jgi:hypothetical protein
MNVHVDDFDRLIAQRLGLSEDQMLQMAADSQPAYVVKIETGERIRTNRKNARRGIAYGEYAETVPDDPEAAKKWLVEQRKRVVEALEAKYFKTRRDILSETLSVLEDYEGWCAENDCLALPASVPVIVRYLLSRVADKKLELHAVSRRSERLGVAHECTKHPPSHIGLAAYHAFNRALSFAENRLRAENKNIFECSAGKFAKAAEMFADGIVPMKYHEVAA